MTKFGNSVLCYQKIEIFGTPYHVGSFIVLDVSQSEKEFGQILNIIKIDEKIIFETLPFEESFFDDHIHAYVVEKKKEKKYCEYGDIPVKFPCVGIAKNNRYFIATRYSL